MNNNYYSVPSSVFPNYLGGRISAFNWINNNTPVTYTEDTSFKPETISSLSHGTLVFRV